MKVTLRMVRVMIETSATGALQLRRYVVTRDVPWDMSYHVPTLISCDGITFDVQHTVLSLDNGILYAHSTFVTRLDRHEFDKELKSMLAGSWGIKEQSDTTRTMT